jgi:hypothetical protein
MPRLLATLVNREKRVMAYTMPGPQANRGTLAGHYLALIVLANMRQCCNEMKHLVALGPMTK